MKDEKPWIVVHPPYYDTLPEIGEIVVGPNITATPGRTMWRDGRHMWAEWQLPDGKIHRVRITTYDEDEYRYRPPEPSHPCWDVEEPT